MVAKVMEEGFCPRTAEDVLGFILPFSYARIGINMSIDVSCVDKVELNNTYFKGAIGFTRNIGGGFSYNLWAPKDYNPDDDYPMRDILIAPK